MHRTFRSILTPEESATYARWMRAVATLYGCGALLVLLAAITLPSASPVQPRGSAVLADPPPGRGLPYSAVRRAAQQREWRSGPVGSSLEAGVGPDASHR
jgi:hypothetical protein